MTGCGGDDGSSARADRVFAAADIHLADDGGLLLVGTATRGDWDSEYDDYCDGDGSATRDLAILELTSDGRLEGTHALDEDDLDGCAVEIRRTSMDEGRLLVEAVVRESPGLIPGEGGPESREHDYATGFDPAADEFENTRGEERSGYAKVAYAAVAIPGGDIVTIAEDPARQRRTEEGYTGTIALSRRSESGAPVWSRPVRAISPDVDTHDLVWAGRGWELFVDSRGISGFAWYSTLSGENEVVLFRHGLDGLPDASFGDGGRVLVDAPWFHRTKRAIRLADRDFVVAGAAGEEEPGRILLRRFSADGEPRPAFDRAAAQAVSCAPPVALAARTEGGLFVACSSGGRAVVHALGDDGQAQSSFGAAGKAVIDGV